MGNGADLRAAELESEGAAELDASGVAPAGQSDLALLRSGEIDEAEYFDRLADQATRHLEGAVSRERLAVIRGVVRAQLPHASGALGSEFEGELDELDSSLSLAPLARRAVARG